MAIRKEQEIRLRREVKDIVSHHLFKLNDELRAKSIIEVENPVNLDNIIDDIMGAVDKEDNYRVQDFQDTIEKQRANLINEHIAKEHELRCTINELQSKVSHLQNKISTDDVKKELERKLSKALEKVRTLKKIVQISLEDM